MDEKKSLQEVIDELVQSEMHLKEQCEDLRASLSESKIKCSLAEKKSINLENKLRKIEDNCSLLSDTLLGAREQFETQQVTYVDSIFCLRRKV